MPMNKKMMTKKKARFEYERNEMHSKAVSTTKINYIRIIKFVIQYNAFYYIIIEQLFRWKRLNVELTNLRKEVLKLKKKLKHEKPDSTNV